MKTNIFKPKEVWKKIKSFHNYQVSNYGNIRRKLKTNSFHYLKPQISNFGYNIIGLRKNNKFYHIFVHRIVLSVFSNSGKITYKNRLQVNHKDGNKLNNHISNLEWVTSSENRKHALNLGLAKITVGEQCSWSKLTNKSVKKLRKIYSKGNISMKKLGEKFGITNETVHGIIHKRYWSHI